MPVLPTGSSLSLSFNFVLRICVCGGGEGGLGVGGRGVGLHSTVYHNMHLGIEIFQKHVSVLI